jgi:hypothetical protein
MIHNSCQRNRIQENTTGNRNAARLTFFHPDCTVGPGLSPDPASQRHVAGVATLAGFTADRELPRRSDSNHSVRSPCPEGFQASPCEMGTWENFHSLLYQFLV